MKQPANAPKASAMDAVHPIRSIDPIDRIDPIAIVVVTRNCRAELEETVRSVLDLRDPRVTLYIVDGASTDATVDYLRTLPDPPVKWVSEPDRGIYDAMNKGWQKVPVDHYVLYMGAGDKPLSLPTPETLKAAAVRGIRIVTGHCDIGERPFPSNWTAYLYQGNTAHHQALLIHKSLHPSPPFDATMKVYADWEFNLRLFMSGQRAQHDSSFHSYALPGGVSADISLWEVWRICYRHTGIVNALRALLRNWRAKMSLAKAQQRPS